MEGFVTDIEKKTLENKHFREVIFTGPHCQLVVMCLNAGEEIGREIEESGKQDGLDGREQPRGDHRGNRVGGVVQFLRVESGHGRSVLNGEEHELFEGSAIVVPSGVEHNIINLSDNAPLKLYTIYAPPQHADGTIHQDKAEAEAGERKEQLTG